MYHPKEKSLTPPLPSSGCTLSYHSPCSQVSHTAHLVPDSNLPYLEIAHSLSLLTHDGTLSDLVQREIGRRGNDTPAILPLLKHLHSSLPANIIGYMMRLINNNAVCWFRTIDYLTELDNGPELITVLTRVASL